MRNEKDIELFGILLIKEVCQSLDDRQLSVLRWVHVEDVSLGDIAERQGIKVSTVVTIYRDALNRMRWSVEKIKAGKKRIGELEAEVAELRAANHSLIRSSMELKSTIGSVKSMTPLGQLSISARVQRILELDNVMTVGALATRTSEGLMKYYGMGKSSIRECEELLRGFGLRFGMNWSEVVATEGGKLCLECGSIKAKKK